MKTSFSNNLCRLPALLLTGLICGGLGWWLHDLTGQKMTGTVATPTMESLFSTPMLFDDVNIVKTLSPRPGNLLSSHKPVRPRAPPRAKNASTQ